MVLAVSPEAADDLLKHFADAGEKAAIIGKVTSENQIQIDPVGGKQ